jgi:hypothetical protein
MRHFLLWQGSLQLACYQYEVRVVVVHGCHFHEYANLKSSLKQRIEVILLKIENYGSFC